MPAAISESYLSRPFTLARRNGRELIFDVTGTDDEAEVQALLLATAPAAYQGLAIESVEAEPYGRGVWKARAKYVYFEDDSEYTFDTGGGTQKLTQSLATVASYGIPGTTPPDFQGAIGVTEDRVEGVEVPAPAFTCSETHRFSDAFVLGGFRKTLFQMTGKVNSAPWKDFDTGECQFLGSAGTKRGDELWSITFRFAGSPNATGLVVGDITGVDKLGWDYLWIRYGDFEDGTAKSLVKRPVACYIERVSQQADFSLLGIGV